MTPTPPEGPGHPDGPATPTTPTTPNDPPRVANAGQRRLFIGAGAVAALAGFGLAWWRSGGIGTAPADAERNAGPAEQVSSVLDSAGGGTPIDRFWSLTLPRPDGTELALSTLRGAPLLVNFWATWCPPCVREMPALDRFQADREGRQGQVLGIAIDQAEPVNAFLQRVPVRFPIVLAGFEGTAWARDFGNAQGGLPFSVLLDAEGQIADRHIGELTAENLADWAQRMG